MAAKKEWYLMEEQNNHYSNPPGVTNYISKTAKIGKNVKIWHFAYVGNDTIIGDNVMIGSLTHVDYKVKIGKNVFIGPGATFTNDPYPMSPKMVGVTVEDGAIIASRAVVKPGVRIGKNSVVAMAAVVTKDVPPDIVVMGHPARIKYSKAEYDRKKAEWDLHA